MNIPTPQPPVHFPSTKENPGKQRVHRRWSIVDAKLKLGIEQDTQFAPQPKTDVSKWLDFLKDDLLSHVLFLLFATNPFLPSHTPSLSTATHRPFKKKVPGAHSVHSLFVGPVQVAQTREHTVHRSFCA